MNVNKLFGIAGVAFALLAAFVAVPYATPILAVCGAVVGWVTPADSHVRVIVSGLALHVLAATFDEIPTVGPYLTEIIGNLGSVLAGAAIAIVLLNIARRIRN